MKTDKNGRILSTKEIVEQQRTRERNRAFTGFMIVLVLMSLFYWQTARADVLGVHTDHTFQAEFAASSIALKWPGPVYVDQTAGSGPITAEVLRQGIEHAIWSWSERGDLTMRHVGIAPTETGGASGRVTVVWTTTAGLQALGSGKGAMAATRKWYYTDSGFIAGAVIYLDQVWFLAGMTDCAQHILVHEIGHALGVNGHTGDRHDVMAATQTHCRYALSAADVTAAGYGQDVCYAEIMRDGSVYLPSGNGVTGWLRPEGGNVYRLEHVTNTAAKCSTITVDSGLRARVTDLRGNGLRYGSASLRHIGGDKWLLEHAE